MPSYFDNLSVSCIKKIFLIDADCKLQGHNDSTICLQIESRMKSVYALTHVNTLTFLSCHPLLCLVGGKGWGAIKGDRIVYDVP